MRSRSHALWVLLLALAPAPAFAHEGTPLAPHDLVRAWVWSPAIVIPLALVAVIYAVGLRRLWSHRSGLGIRRWEAACFACGWLVMVAALVSPLHPLGEVLFSAHMVQHELLMVIAAPLLVLGRPLIPWLHVLPERARPAVAAITHNRPSREMWKLVTGAGAAFVIQTVVLWGWHIPHLYDEAVRSDVVHALQHLSFIIASLLFWWAVLNGTTSHGRRTLAVICLFGTALHSTLLGALLVVAPHPLYAAYAVPQPQWGLTPLEDQQLAGLIMWVPAGISYLAAALVLAAGWLREPVMGTLRRDGWSTRAATAVALALLCGLAGCDYRDPARDAAELTHGDPVRGQALTQSFGCGSCHTIPGVRGATATVGPPLSGIAGRSYIGGVLTNDPDNMVRWLRDPPAVDSNTAMPDVGLSPSQARDVAAYLYTLR